MRAGYYFFFFSSRRRHTRCREVSWARRCVQETGINAEYMGVELKNEKNQHTSCAEFTISSLGGDKLSVTPPREPPTKPKYIRTARLSTVSKRRGLMERREGLKTERKLMQSSMYQRKEDKKKIDTVKNKIEEIYNKYLSPDKSHISEQEVKESTTLLELPGFKQALHASQMHRGILSPVRKSKFVGGGRSKSIETVPSPNELRKKKKKKKKKKVLCVVTAEYFFFFFFFFFFYAAHWVMAQFQYFQTFLRQQILTFLQETKCLGAFDQRGELVQILEAPVEQLILQLLVQKCDFYLDSNTYCIFPQFCFSLYLFSFYPLSVDTSKIALTFFLSQGLLFFPQALFFCQRLKDGLFEYIQVLSEALSVVLQKVCLLPENQS
eukprot:TRINITY_DN29261_c0_g1_i2.p1 TRINITY_DN29261_c0_g1~~TRINITY_DN29261_c0_g1_i2.p1  ORF type:complete len:380 (+),score=75.48 TRINITY_DN29261_c0_g1_i2:73-1212(+)